MFFTASKLAWFVAAPTNALLILLAAGAVLHRMGLRRSSRWAGSCATAALLVIGFGPAGNLLLRPLEDRFPAPAELEAPTGIIVLGGSTDEIVTAARDQVTVANAADRITEAVALSRRFPAARLVFTGGSAALVLKTRTEAEDTRRLWIALGVAPDRITTEDRSRTTFENALFTEQLVDRKPGDRWLLVTSAYHMPRAVGAFRAVGFPITPYPVDYFTTGDNLDLLPRRSAADGLGRFDLAVKEWVGLAAYRLTGRIKALFPRPES